MTDIALFQQEINAQVADPKVAQALLATTFKKLTVENMKSALLEGRIRGFSFKDFLDKNIYAVPFGQGYSLVTSIEYARKIGMKSGIVGKNAPVYTENENGEVVTGTVTVKRMVNNYVGEFTALVYFKEYYAGHKNEDGTIKKNNYGDIKPTLWDTKPRTMIAKVAEMHALRMACPEELAQSFIEEEMEREAIKVEPVTVTDIPACQAKLEAAKSLDELSTIWSAIPAEAKLALEDVKNKLKTKFTIIDGEVVEQKSV